MPGARNLTKGINCDANVFVAKVAEASFIDDVMNAKTFPELSAA
jgi:hypothetical protein